MADLNNLTWFKLNDFKPSTEKLLALKEIPNDGGNAYFYYGVGQDSNVIIPVTLESLDKDSAYGYKFFNYVTDEYVTSMDMAFNPNDTYWAYLPETLDELTEEIMEIHEQMEEGGEPYDIWEEWLEGTQFRRYEV